ncbi:FkbM family methyltransferase [Azospirillum sp. TSO35-2]|uniref:FkbM family methyltransferase n=1 Tax=Azospirillum sp. TSO35-2 TaxID=716796 RepID=UPI000D60F188|nr:FkbM family methyltransferase [Azospirillum sp. TSO35-2]PWC33001.1 hypothetical protein TSO352_20790 [Azospirillum sp. TSO35-2]
MTQDRLSQDEIFQALCRLADESGGKAGSHDFFRAVHRQALRGMGLSNDATIAETGETGVLRYVQSVMTRKGRPDFVIFDVGANVGTYSRAALDACGQARVYAFEPSAVAFRSLAAVAAERPDRLSVFNIGFSDHRAIASLHAADAGSALGSLYARRIAPSGDAFPASETVRLERIDDFCDANGIDRIDFLKIDVEGHEIAVLNGAADRLRRGCIDIIQFEFGGCNIDSRSFLRDFIRILDGYSLCRILKDGLYQLTSFSDLDEIFSYQNFLAIRQ